MLNDVKNFTPIISSIFDELMYDGLNIKPKRDYSNNIYLCNKHLLELLKDSGKCNNMSELKAITRCIPNIDKIYVKEHKVISYNRMTKQYIYMNRDILKFLQELSEIFVNYKTFGDDKFFTDFSILTETEQKAKLLIHIDVLKNFCEVYNLAGNNIFHPTKLVRSELNRTLIETLQGLLKNQEPVDPIIVDYKLSVIDLKDLLYYSKIIETNKSKSKFKPSYKLNIGCLNDDINKNEYLLMTEIINENWTNPELHYKKTEISSDLVLKLLLHYIENTDFDITNLCDKISTEIFPRILRSM